MTRRPGTRRARRRAGFTLIETVVTVGLLAVLAAFVVPTIVQKVGAGDPVKVQNDLNTVRTALESFAADVKRGFPHQISTLTTRPIPTVDQFIDSTALTVAHVTAWNGPYLSAMMPPGPTDSIATGYDAHIINFIERYDALNNVPEHMTAGQAPTGAWSSTSTMYAGVQIHGLTLAQARTINRAIDGDGDNPTQTSVDVTGRFRYGAASNGFVVAWFLAAPITR